MNYTPFFNYEFFLFGLCGIKLWKLLMKQSFDEWLGIGCTVIIYTIHVGFCLILGKIKRK